MWARARISSDGCQMIVWILYQLLCMELKEAKEGVRGLMHRHWQSLRLLSNVDPLHVKRDACAICCEPLPRCAVVLNCGHSYHWTCLRSWLRRKPTCPLCRRIVRNA